MTFDIEKFKSSGLIYGGARPSLFKVFVPPMPGLGGDLTEKISYVAKAASIPPSVIAYIDVPYMSRHIRLNGDRTFPEWTMSILNDEDFSVRHAFEMWHQHINKRRENCQDGTGLVKDYKLDLTVHQYSKACDPSFVLGKTSATNLAGPDQARPIRTYTLVGAFPTEIGPIGLDWDARDTIEQFDVTFAYDYWEPLEITNSSETNIIFA